MAFTVAQLEFVGLHLGVVIAPDFIENKRRQEEFKKLRAQFATDHPDLNGHHQQVAITAALQECDELARAGTRYAAALEALARAKKLVELPPPQPPPQSPQAKPVAAEQPAQAADTPESAYRKEKAKLIEVIHAAAGESADLGGEDIKTWIDKTEVQEKAGDWPNATKLLRETHRKAELLLKRKPYLVARQAHIHKINAAKKIKQAIPPTDTNFPGQKTYGAAVTVAWEEVLKLVKADDFTRAAAGVDALAGKIDSVITPTLSDARKQNAVEMATLKAQLDEARTGGDPGAMRDLAEQIFDKSAQAEGLGIDAGENARKPFTPDAVWTADKCEQTFVAYDWFALKKCRKARKIMLGSDELAFSDDDMWKLVQYRGKVVSELIDGLRKEYPTLIAKASGSEDIESDIDITFATPGSGDDVKAAQKFNAAIKTRFKKPPGRVFDVNIYPRDYGAIKESFKADYNVEEIQDQSIDEPDQEESAKLSKIDQDVATLLKQRRFLDTDKFNEMLKAILASAPDEPTRKRIEKQYEEGEDIYLLTSLEKVEKLRAQVKLGDPKPGEPKHKTELREKLTQLDKLTGKGDRASLAKAQDLVPAILNLFEEGFPDETMDVTDAQYLEKMGRLREDQDSIRSLKQANATPDAHHPKQTCEQAHPKTDHETWRKEHLNAMEVKVKKDIFTNIVFANEAIVSQGAINHVVQALQERDPVAKAEKLKGLKSEDLMQSVNEQVSELFKETKHYDGVVEEAEEEAGDAQGKEDAKRRATGEGFVHASKYFFRLLDAAISLNLKYPDEPTVQAPYEAVANTKKLDLQKLKDRTEKILLNLRKSADVPPDVKGEVGVLEIQELFPKIKTIDAFRKMIAAFSIELNLRIRSLPDFKQSQEMATEKEKAAEKAYFKAAAPKPGPDETDRPASGAEAPATATEQYDALKPRIAAAMIPVTVNPLYGVFKDLDAAQQKLKAAEDDLTSKIATANPKQAQGLLEAIVAELSKTEPLHVEASEKKQMSQRYTGLGQDLTKVQKVDASKGPDWLRDPKDELVKEVENYKKKSFKATAAEQKTLIDQVSAKLAPALVAVQKWDLISAAAHQLDCAELATKGKMAGASDALKSAIAELKTVVLTYQRGVAAADVAGAQALLKAVTDKLGAVQKLSAGRLTALNDGKTKASAARATAMKLLKEDPEILKTIAADEAGRDFIDKMVGDLGGTAKEKDANLDKELKGFVKSALKARFNIDKLEGDLTSKALPRLYKVLRSVPEHHVKDNDRLKAIERHRGSTEGASWYKEEENLVQLNLERTGTFQLDYQTLGNKIVSEFDATTLHEIGHSVDEKLKFMNNHQKDDQFGAWKSISVDDVVAVAGGSAVLGAKKPFFEQWKQYPKTFLEAYLQQALKSQEESAVAGMTAKKEDLEKEPAIVESKAQRAANKPEEGKKLDPKLKAKLIAAALKKSKAKDNQLKELIRKIVEKIIEGTELKTAVQEMLDGCKMPDVPAKPDFKGMSKHPAVGWCHAVGLKGDHDGLWEQGKSGATKYAVDKVVYQEAYKNQWWKYSVGARSKGVSDYQFRAPGEWFSEIYSAFYLGAISKTHPDYKWFKEEVHDVVPDAAQK